MRRIKHIYAAEHTTALIQEQKQRKEGGSDQTHPQTAAVLLIAVADTVILIGIWVSVPYVLLQITGILQNIPQELYESARVDGAGPLVTFYKITLPYMLFVTTPYLITSFTGNITSSTIIS